MDWGRAKSIMIISFFLLNALLGFQLWTSRAEQSVSLSDLSVVKAETEQLLEDKHIRLTASVPKDAPKLRQITASLGEKYRNAQRVNLSKPIPYSGFVIRNSLREVIYRAGIENGTAYKADPGYEQKGIILLTQMAGELPLFDITLQLFEQNGEIVGYKQAYVEVQSGGEQKELKVISAYTALRSLADILPEGSVIKDVRLGYHGQRYDSEIQVMPPYWRVVLEDGETYYVQAFSGAVEGPVLMKKDDSKTKGQG